MKRTSAMTQEITNISCQEIHETNIGHEARNYKHLMPGNTWNKHRPWGKKLQTSHAGKYMKQTSVMRQEITNISCQEIDETNIGHDARNYKHLMPGNTWNKHRPWGKKLQTSHAGKYMKQTSVMRQEITHIPCRKNIGNKHRPWCRRSKISHVGSII